ncbi:MAG: hypothetical protein LBP58_08050 [Azoarcus sp.]|nr:hypothetical protein [Azoarcus sp.]
MNTGMTRLYGRAAKHQRVRAGYAIAQAFSAVSLSDISGWFRHDGYALH